MTVPVTAIPALAPVVRSVFGVDEGCGKIVIICGEVLDEKSVKGFKELDAEDVTVETCDVMLEAENVIVEARSGSVEEGINDSSGPTVVKDTFSCSGEGASKLSFEGFEQSSPSEPRQQDHKPLVALKTIS